MYDLKSILHSFEDTGHHLPYVSKITSADKELLGKTVSLIRPDSKFYEDSWGYIIQATRYGQCRWYDPSTGSLIFFGRKTTSPELVVPIFFAKPKYLGAILTEVLTALNIPQAILKNANPADISDFLPYGFRQYRAGECWSTLYPLGDQTYPQLIVDLQQLMKHRGDAYQNLRTTLNKKNGFSLRKYAESDREAVIDIFLAVDKQHHILPKTAPGYFETHEMYPDSETERFVIIDDSHKIIGFTATSEISQKTTALVAALFQPDIKGVCTWGIYKTLEAQYRKGFQLANLGGCGSKTVYLYKREKFRPIEEIEKTHLVFDNPRS